MTSTLALILSIAAILACLGGLGLGVSRVRKLERLATEQYKLITQFDDQIKALTHGGAGMTSHLSRLDQQLRRIVERQDQIEMRDPVRQGYDHAINLVRRGATADELIKKLGLIRDEAELLVQMYGLDKAS